MLTCFQPCNYDTTISMLEGKGFLNHDQYYVNDIVKYTKHNHELSSLTCCSHSLCHHSLFRSRSNHM